ncbi:two-component regulator propeller domain-containing protein [Bacteroides sp. 51]|uniref:hybrid sensor histidine kinase/response regulator transcription factor n=1 Tax=Bacteroides sp. 51 TaxID=2302938 RepID=UPI0013D51BF8|nr:two-component regulator propeller domain-containing protein [Bacteroides sp. 51]
MRLILFTTYLLIPAFLSGNNFLFEHLGVDDGLSHVTVNCAYQDELGMIWFGTRDGLNKYDGNEVKTFKQIYGDATTTNSTIIKTIVGDGNGYLYFQTPMAVIRFDIKKETFNTLLDEGNGALAIGKNGIWIGVKSKLYLYNSRNEELKLVHTIKDASFNSIFESSDQVCLLGTNSGLYTLDANNTLSKFIPASIVNAVYEDRNKNIWICTHANGLVKMCKNEIVKYYTHQSNNPKSIVNNSVRTICEDDFGYLWIGSQFGLSRMNIMAEEFQTYTHDVANRGSLTSNSVMNLFKDRQGTIWISTFFGGVNYMNPEDQKISYYYQSPKGLPYPIVGKFTEDKNKLIWITTEGGSSIASFNPQTTEFVSYSIPGNNYKEIYYDSSEHCLWLGTHLYEIIRFDIATQKTIVYKSDINDPSNYFGRHIWAIRPYDNKLVIGSTIGVRLYDPETRKSTHFLPEINTLVTSMIIDSHNKLWVGTEKKGLFCYDLNHKALFHYTNKNDATNSLSSNSINCIIEDKKQQIWVGTNGGGLNLFRPDSNDFQVYTQEKDNLIDNTITALAASMTNHILIGTNVGVSSYDMDKDKFSNYSYKNGFPLSTINEGSLFVSSQGDIFAGGVTGMVMFSEDDLQPIRKPFNIQFTKLYINNKEISQGDAPAVLSSSVPYVDQINIQPRTSAFSICFTTDNYIKSFQDDVEYRLYGYESEWMDAQFGRMLTYTNLNPGEYLLELRAKDFPEITKQMKIIVEPPFYRTWLAYLVYILILAAIIYWVLKQMKARFNLRTSLELEKKEKEKNEEITQAKLRFFTNISHEIRTPITLIMGQTEHLLQSFNVPPMVYNKIMNINKNANNLYALINELLDFRKQEQGYLQLKISYLNLVELIEEIYLTFKEYASNNQITFNFEKDLDEAFVWIDKEQMQKVINNLLSNAFKYTPKGGAITLSVRSVKDTISFSVTDTGQGIELSKMERIFDRFFQADFSNKISGTGIGLALAKGIVEAHSGCIKVKSELNKGSTFTVSLKTGDAHFDANVIRKAAEVAVVNDSDLEPEFVEEMLKSSGNETERSRIVIVEDNEDVRNLLEEVLSPLFMVETAVDGEDGLQKARELLPDLIISDIMMPKMSGIDLCSMIKNNLDTCHIPVILLTAKTAVEHKFEGLRLGADDYIVKPFDLKLLILRCNNLINSRKILQTKFIQQPTLADLNIATTAIDQKIIEKATKVVEQNLSNSDFNIDIFASKMGLGRTSLFSKIKGVTGLTPNNFILNIRLKKSSEMLLNNPELNISEIAFSLGFSDARYYNKCFKSLFGYTPSEYRKKEISTKVKNNNE